MPPRGYTVASLQNLDPKTSSKSLSGKFSRLMFWSSGAAAQEPQVTLLENTGRNFFSSLPGSIYDSPMCGNILPSLLNISHRLFGSTWQPSLHNMFTTWPSYQELEGMKVSVTTVQDRVSTFVSVTPLNTFIPVVFVDTKTGILNRNIILSWSLTKCFFVPKTQPENKHSVVTA